MSLQKLGIKAGTYHANMDAKYKTKVHKGWAANQIQVKILFIDLCLIETNCVLLP